ncbi:MAG: pimeloyl-ACP methyl ester carboxylesterase [Cyclobacteriaceae bacterium]|jgi:pimeloyl-ACP methyl ester carboxylesterase
MNKLIAQTPKQMQRQSEPFILNSPHDNRPFLSDVRYLSNGKAKPIILLIHGFKGFKDFMYFNLLADLLCDTGFVVVKMNLSHNGTTPDQPVDFADLEAFGNNNYTIELGDIGVMLDHIENSDFKVDKEELDLNKIYLMGHSRGGGISIVKASEDNRIKKLITLASVSSLTSVMPVSVIEEWKKAGVHYVFNGRTKQSMPLYYQLAEDYLANKDRFNVLECEKKLKIPHLIIHGNKDETVSVDAAVEIKEKCKNGKLVVIKEATHTFGGFHPYTRKTLPKHAAIALEEIIDFLK